MLNAPRKITFIICLVLIVLAIVANFITIPFVSAYAFWVLAVGAVLLLLSVVLKGL